MKVRDSHGAAMALESTRKAFGEALRDIARDGYDVVGLAADTSKSMGLDILQEEFPGRVFEVGIAEQNMAMVAAGLAAVGKIPFAASYSVFTSMRCLEQVRTFIAYPGLNVKIVGGLGGFTAGIEGVTHTALEDMGILRCIPGLVLLNPADAPSTRKAVRAAADWQGPVCLRIGRDPSPVLFTDSHPFTIGKANLLRNGGDDLGILVTGLPVHQALRAYDQLASEGIRATLMEVHTLKPIDAEAIASLARRTGAILTVEEHYRTGGLASAVAEILVRECPVPLGVVAVEDRFTETGLPDELRDLYGLTADDICREARKLLARKKPA